MSIMRNTADNVKSLITPMQTLNTELATALKTLKEIKAVGAQALQSASSVAKAGGQMGIGQGSNMGLGTNQARFTDTRMAGSSGQVPFRYSIPGSMAYAGAQVGLGILGGAYAAAPDLGITIGRAAGFYGSAIRGPGTTRAGVAQATFSALAGGISGVGEDAAAAAMLVQGYYYRPGSAAFTQTMREVGGAARYLNMDNVTAARALGGMQTGSMGANLYQYGISQFDAQGRPRGFEDIARQLFERSYAHMGGTADYDTVQRDLQYGYLGANLRNMGFSGEQQELMSQAFLDFSQGKGFNLAGKGFGENPLEAQYRMTTSQTSLIERATEPMIKGFETAAGIVEKLNKAMEGLPDAFFELKATIQGVTGSNVGPGLGVLSGGIAAAIGGLMTAAGIRTATRGGKPTSGPKGRAGMLGKLGKLPMLGRLGLAAATYGGLEFLQGQLNKGDWQPDWLRTAGNFAFDVGQGGLTGLATGNLGVAFAGMTAGGAGAILNPYQAPTGTGGGGMGFAASFGATGGNGETGQTISSPIPGAAVTTAYGVKGDMWKWKGYHTGQDYAQPEGTPVRAVAAGTVFDDNPGSSYGEYVQIDHGNGYQTLYGHLKSGSKRVSVGQTVQAGQVIGLVGQTGNVTGPHLHFEVRKGKNNPVNPNEFLKGGTILGTDALSKIDANTGFSVQGMSSAPDLTIQSSIGSDFVLSQMVGSLGFSVSGKSSIPKPLSGTNTVKSSNAGTGGGQYGFSNPLAGNNGGSVVSRTVNVTLTIPQATEQDAIKFAKSVKRYLEDDSSINMIGSY